MILIYFGRLKLCYHSLTVKYLLRYHKQRSIKLNFVFCSDQNLLYKTTNFKANK